jgi:hypothetical protein
MKIGDLVRFKKEGRHERYPYQYEVGVILRFKLYHPVVGFPSKEKYVGRERLEVLSESR